MEGNVSNSTSYRYYRYFLAVLSHPSKFFKHFAAKKLRERTDLCDEEYIKKMFRIKLGYDIDLEHPVTFNEKLNWLKLYNRNPIFTVMVDKHAVKEYVSNLIGGKHVVKELGVYDSFDEIDFESLPNQFVLKTTHGSGGIAICKDKSSFDISKARKKLGDGLKENYYYQCREWPYKDVEPHIIAESFLSDGVNSILPVYKFFCFNGEPFLAQVIQNDKCSDETIDYVDMEWNLLPVKQNYPNSKIMLEKPSCLNEMIRICRSLTKGIPFVRCDLYVVQNQVFFSEFTFYSDSGFEPFYPKEWDTILGDKIIL